MSALTHAPPASERDARREELRLALTDARIVAGRVLRHFSRQPRLIVFSTVQPVMFVLLFAFVFGGAIGASLPGEVSYVDFLLPGILVQSASFRATQTSVGLAEDMERGVIDRFKSMPIARSAVLTGRTLADLVRSLFVLVLMIGVGYAIGFRFRAGFLEALGAIAIVALFGYALSWIFAWLAMVVPGAEAVQSASFVAVFPLVFASSAFVPVESMPDWLRTFAEVQPITVTVDAARALAIGGPFGADLAVAIAWSVGLGVTFMTLSVRRFTRVE